MKKKRMKKEMRFIAERASAATWRASDAEQLLTELIHHIGVSNIPRDLGMRYLDIKRRAEEENALWDRFIMRHAERLDTDNTLRLIPKKRTP